MTETSFCKRILMEKKIRKNRNKDLIYTSKRRRKIMDNYILNKIERE